MGYNMKFRTPAVSLIRQENGYSGMLKHIELCGRVSYKSEERITEDSYQKFIDMLCTKGHKSPLEHGTVYLTIPKQIEGFVEECDVVLHSKYAECVTDDDFYYVTTNYRVVEPLGSDFIGQFWSLPTKHVKRVTLKVVCSRGVGYEAVRHRLMSFTQESTRYCNYSKDKHGNELMFILPSWIDDIKPGESFSEEMLAPEKLVTMMLSGKQAKSPKTMILISSHICAEKSYLELLKLGCKPEEARDVLPNGLKTEIVLTGTIPQWKMFLELRSKRYGAKGVHPDMVVVADDIYHTLVAEGLIEEKEQV